MNDLKHHSKSRWILPLLLIALTSCTAEDSSPVDYMAPGPYAVGGTTVMLEDTERGRQLRVEIWYPAPESARALAEEGEAVELLVSEGAERDQFTALLDTAMHCVSHRNYAARDAALSEAKSKWPLLLFSHCHGCLRFSSMFLSQHLASHGFVVVSPCFFPVI